MEIIKSNQYDKAKLIMELQSIVNTWIGEKPKRSVASLARATGVADPALRRLLNSSTKPFDDSIFRILTYILHDETFDGVAKILKDYNKVETLKWFSRHFSFLKMFPLPPEHKYTSITDQVAANLDSYFIYNLVLVLERVSEKYILKQIGITGELELDRMIDLGILCEDNGDIYLKENVSLKFTKEQVARLLPEVSKVFFKASHGRNSRALEVGAVTIDGYNKLTDIYNHFLHEVQTVYREKPGDIPVIVAGFFDSFTKQPYFNDNKK